MKVITENLGKRFNREWIFRNFNYQFIAGKKYAVNGPNGSGKSTLLQVLSGAMPCTEGEVRFNDFHGAIPFDSSYRKLSITAPYLDVIEEFTLEELLKFHLSFRQLTCTKEEFARKTGLENSYKKEIRYYSSGMKQRVKLGLSVFDPCPLVLLDEPTVNFDSKGIEWYRSEVNNSFPEKIFIIFSNQLHEYDFCDEVIDLMTFKK